MIPNQPHIKEITNEPDFNDPQPVSGPRPNRPTVPYPSGGVADSGELKQNSQKLPADKEQKKQTGNN